MMEVEMAEEYRRILQPVDEKLCDTRWGALKDLLELTCKKLQDKIDAESEKVNIRFDAEEVAREKALLVLAKDLVHLNALRNDVITDRAEFVRVAVYLEFKDRYLEWQREFENKMTEMKTHYDDRMSTAKLISIISVIIAVVAVVVPWFVHK